MRYGSARSREADSRPSPAYYEWRPTGQPLAIHISLDVIDRIGADVMKGFWSVPKRGAEVGGVLFGRARVTEDETEVHIDDYEPVECEHRRGPSYVLSDVDRRRLERTLRKGTSARQVVGFFRSHTRLGLYLDQDDFNLVQNYFPGCSQVFLLVRPHATRTSVAGFFFWEEGTIRRQSTYLEFPFRSAELRQPGEEAAQAGNSEEVTETPAVPVPPVVPAAATPAERTVVLTPFAASVSQALSRAEEWVGAMRMRLAPQIAPVRQRLRHASWKPMALAAAVVVCFLAAEYQLVRFVVHSAPDAAAAVEDPPALRVERSGSYLRVNWNRDASSIVNAARGVLEITDGGSRKQLQLDPVQLRTGSIAYAPSSGDVNFRFEVVGAKSTISESLRVVEGTGRPAEPVPVAPVAAQPVPEAPVLTPPDAAQPAVVKPASTAGQPTKAARPPVRTHRVEWTDDGL